MSAVRPYMSAVWPNTYMARTCPVASKIGSDFSISRPSASVNGCKPEAGSRRTPGSRGSIAMSASDSGINSLIMSTY
eukprot:1466619-Rhodomonas_salina.3